MQHKAIIWTVIMSAGWHHGVENGALTMCSASVSETAATDVQRFAWQEVIELHRLALTTCALTSFTVTSDLCSFTKMVLTQLLEDREALMVMCPNLHSFLFVTSVLLCSLRVKTCLLVDVETVTN